MISQIFDSGSFKVLALFTLSPGSRFKRKEIKERTMMHNVPLDRALTRLCGSGIIKKERGLYSINLDSAFSAQIIPILAFQHKQLKNLPLAVYFLLSDAIMQLSAMKGLEQVWLFGSYSKLVYSDKSDIDIALLATRNFTKDKAKKALKRLENQYKKEIEEHYFDPKAFYSNKRDPLVKDILQNGIRLL